MITLKVTAIEFGGEMKTEVKGEIRGRRGELVYEVAHILLEFDNLGDDILTDAFGLMLDELTEEKANEN